MVDFKLYLITDRNVANKPLPVAMREALAGGVPAVQLREKDLPIRDMLNLARELRALTREYSAKLIINDRVDVAYAVGADGVHLGRTSIPPAAARKIVGDKMLIGVSTHSIEEARTAAADGADFITFGPVYETPSKMQYGAPLGLDALRIVVREIDIPVYGIGGISAKLIPQVLETKAAGVAMISAILAAPDIMKTARTIVETINLADRERCLECGPRQ